MRNALILVLSLVLNLVAGCAALDDAWKRVSGTGVVRTFDAPIARVKPAAISTLAAMGMMITSLEARGTGEVIKAKKGASGVEIELERLSRTSTRMRVATSGGGLLHDDATAAKIIQQTERLLAKG